MQKLTTEELKTKITNGESFVVDFFTNWCGPCKILLKNIKIMEGKIKNVTIYTFDVESDKEFALRELGIRSVPTVKYFKEGQVVETKTGVQTPDQLAESIRTNLSLV